MKLPQISLRPSEDEHLRRAARVLQMVHELHKAGYQGLRICPGMSESGNWWRVGITPVRNVCSNHGACLADWEWRVAKYSSAQGAEYFEWKDAASDSALELAVKFIERFPEIAEAGLRADWAYAGWYVELLGLVERDELPMAYADFTQTPRKGFLPTTKHWFDSRMPMPPPGGSERKAECPYL